VLKRFVRHWPCLQTLPVTELSPRCKQASKSGSSKLTCHLPAGLSKLAEDEAKKLVIAALAVAKDIVLANKQTHDGLSRDLEQKERLEGQALRDWLSKVNPTDSLRHFVLQGVPPAMENVTPAKAMTS